MEWVFLHSHPTRGGETVPEPAGFAHSPTQPIMIDVLITMGSGRPTTCGGDPSSAMTLRHHPPPRPRDVYPGSSPCLPPSPYMFHHIALVSLLEVKARVTFYHKLPICPPCGADGRRPKVSKSNNPSQAARRPGWAARCLPDCVTRRRGQDQTACRALWGIHT